MMDLYALPTLHCVQEQNSQIKFFGGQGAGNRTPTQFSTRTFVNKIHVEPRAYKEKRACNTNISCENTENWVVTKNSSFRYQLSPDKYGGKRNLTTRHNGCLNKTLNSTKAERHIVERSIKDRYSFSAMWYCLSLVAEISETAERRRVLRAKLYRDSATETGNICCYSLHKWRLAILSIASWPSSRRIKL